MKIIWHLIVIYLATSIKAYVDSSVAGKDNTDEITEGSSNILQRNIDDRVNVHFVNVAISYDDANNDLDEFFQTYSRYRRPQIQSFTYRSYCII